MTSSGVFDLKNQLNFTQRILPRLDESKYLKHLLAATIILKTNAKIDYIQMLANSTIDPMQRVVFIGDIRQLRYEKKPNCIGDNLRVNPNSQEGFPRRRKEKLLTMLSMLWKWSHPCHISPQQS